MSDYSHLSVLIVDPNQSMRSSVHNMLTQINISKVDHAVNAATAIRQLSMRSYDVILCEYDLGGSGDQTGQDGQQLLEDLRHHRIIPQWAIFMMLTSEGVYNKVIGAAELQPSDYVLKPFTVEVISQRITRALQRRAALLPVYQMVSQGRASDAITTCQELVQSQPRYALEFARLRAEVLTSLERHSEAEQAYAAILKQKPLGWAQLGQARSIQQQGRLADAEALLKQLVADNPEQMAAYDLLAAILRGSGRDAEAKTVLEDAVAISPHMVVRLRSLGDVALATGDVDAAERAYKQVLVKSRHSEFRDASDHVNLVRTLVKKGDAAGAAATARDLERSLRSTPTTDVCHAYANAMVKELNGDTAGAAAALDKAMTKLSESTGMSSNIKLGLAHSCLKNGLDEQAVVLLDELIADPSSGIGAAQVEAVCREANRVDFVKRYEENPDAAVDAAVREAAELSRGGAQGDAVDVLRKTLRRYPDHHGLRTVAVTAILRLLNDSGWDAELATECTGLLRRIREEQANHPLLPGLIAQYATLRKKYAPPS
ncbi:tetratricopeptide repeat protein [Duganella sp. FT80W]|uniref:Tetratricopeptide repeat protein n=1 Tax=Duganella guangzhouensis TaxID=2666084 RepID=A0A6I2L3C8_9BURK|nr:response regulator [Duganella guangzhouensis]MRW92383.1 tetratricopeptide repeat protein [Duganella guangzhouensis]